MHRAVDASLCFIAQVKYFFHSKILNTFVDVFHHYSGIIRVQFYRIFYNIHVDHPQRNVLKK